MEIYAIVKILENILKLWFGINSRVGSNGANFPQRLLVAEIVVTDIPEFSQKVLIIFILSNYLSNIFIKALDIYKLIDILGSVHLS